jgi:hypothetical protein
MRDLSDTHRRRGLGGLALGAVVATLVFAASATPGFGGDTGTVAATVTVAAPCLVIDSETIDFGVKAFSTPDATVSAAGGNGYQNCGPSSEKVLARGTNATSTSGPPATWTLQSDDPCSAGPNTYKLRATVGAAVPYVLSTTSVEIDTLTTPGEHRVVNTDLYMPCSGSDGAGQQMAFQYVFTATF